MLFIPIYTSTKPMMSITEIPSFDKFRLPSIIKPNQITLIELSTFERNSSIALTIFWRPGRTSLKHISSSTEDEIKFLIVVLDSHVTDRFTRNKVTYLMNMILKNNQVTVPEIKFEWNDNFWAMNNGVIRNNKLIFFKLNM